MAPPEQPKLRLKDRRRRLMWVKVAAGTSVVVVSLALVFYVAHLPAMTIAQVNVTGTNLVHADDVRQLVSAQLSGSFAYLIPHANAFFVPAASIKTAITHSFPPVASVSISRKNLQELDVAITERQSAALWCQPRIDGSSRVEAGGETASSSDCYSMDAGGYIFAKATGTSGLLAYYGALKGTPIGNVYLQGTFAILAVIVKNIGTSIHLTPRQVVVYNNDADVDLTFAEGGVLRFERTADRQTTLENVASVFASQDFKSHAQFEYVDFRFGDKVYVKFK